MKIASIRQFLLTYFEFETENILYISLGLIFKDGGALNPGFFFLTKGYQSSHGQNHQGSGVQGFIIDIST